MPQITITGREARTLDDLAKQYGVSPDSIRSANEGVNLDQPMGPGSKLNIPYQAPVAPAVSDIDPAQAPMMAPAQVELPQPTAVGVAEDFIVPLSQTVQNQRKRLEATYQAERDRIAKERQEAEAKVAELSRKSEGVIEGPIQELLQPFREQIERSERVRFSVEENFEANQKLVGELEGLLTESNSLIQKLKTQSVPGLAGIQQSARMTNALNNAMGRIGVIEAVMNARSGQIGEAYRMIDRTINAVSADRKDQLAYYETVLNLSESRRDEQGNKILNLDKEDMAFLNAQVSLLEGDLARSQETSDYIKSLMIDPNTAELMAQSGVTIDDSPEQIQQKFADYAYSQEVRQLHEAQRAEGLEWIPTPEAAENIPDNEIVTITDSRGQVHQYRRLPLTTERVGGFEILRDGSGRVISQRVLPTGGTGSSTTIPRDVMVDNWTGQGLDPSLINTNGTLTKANNDRLVREGIPQQFIDPITKSIVSGATLDQIRETLEDSMGREIGWGILDVYMSTLHDAKAGRASGGGSSSGPPVIFGPGQ